MTDETLLEIVKTIAGAIVGISIAGMATFVFVYSIKHNSDGEE